MSMGPGHKTLTRDELVDWLRLIGTESIGPITFKQLLAKHSSAKGSIQALLNSGSKYNVPTTDLVERQLLAAERDGIRAIPSVKLTIRNSCAKSTMPRQSYG